MREEKISQTDGYGKEFNSRTDGNCVQMESQYSQKNTSALSVSEETGQRTSMEIGIALNTLAREQMIHRLLADIAVDLQICKLEGFDPSEYITKLKNEIDNIAEQLRRKK